MQSLTEVDKEELYTLKINCKVKRTVEKANKGINIEKIIIGLKIKIKKRERKKKRKRPPEVTQANVHVVQIRKLGPSEERVLHQSLT